MRSTIYIPFFLSLASALWPIPTSYEHSDTVLFIQEDVPFYWYESGPRNIGSILDQETDRLPVVFASDPDLGFFEQAWHLRRRYASPLFENDEIEGDYEEEVTGDQIIDHAIKRSWNTIFRQNFYPWKFHPRNWSEPSPQTHTARVTEVNLRVLDTDPVKAGKTLAGEIDESYSLVLSKQGKATISANTSIGIAHGLTTFTQLFYLHSDKRHIYTPLAPVKIYDVPRFAHRGINLDVARAWFPVADIERQIDAAAYNKMNRLHLHVTDSQSWPLVIPSLPNLAAKGAYRPDLIYTPAEFDAIQRHAALQGVQVITEIDMPGHTSSIHHSFPELIAAFDRQPDWDVYAAEPPSGTLKLNSSQVADFLDVLFADLMPRIKPYSSYFHTGGDEVNTNAYKLDDSVRSSDFKVLQPLMQRFVDANHERVRKAGLKPIVWEEMLLEWNLKLGDDVVVQSWRSDEAVARIVEKGHNVLVGNYNYWYLDCGKGQWLDFDPSVSESFYPYNDYCAPFHNWRLLYSYDPLAGVPTDKQHLVIGGEAHMWAEQTDPINVDRMIWPRGSAVAEVLWSGAKDAGGKNRSQIDVSPRLSEMRERLVAKGIGAEPIQMPYCTMDGTRCQLGYGGK
ncbi:glycoside hydrolase superfamily [Phaeosphaeriaceae sp. PMI808]|nr:glycoside hydrolase superfamily [Phaeosphaeriaceae sp. PMI808]